MKHRIENILTTVYLAFALVSFLASVIGGGFVGANNYIIGTPVMSAGIGGLVLSAFICGVVALVLFMRQPLIVLELADEPEYSI